MEALAFVQIVLLCCARLVSCQPPPRSLHTPTLQSIESEDWYHGRIKRAEAEKVRPGLIALDPS